MKSPLRIHASVGGRAAFTLIELLAVMAIILVLAGLILNIAGPAQYNSAKARATTEIKAMETALESYKADNGAYPSDSTNVNSGSQPTTEVLDAQNVPKYADPSTYTNASEFLYQALSGYQLNSGTGGAAGTVTVTKRYMNFRPDQLHLAPNGTGVTVVNQTSPYMYIIDPFGFSYGYSTIYSITPAATEAQTPMGYNPTFDLWSTGGYASGGKAMPTNTPAPSSVAAGYSALWIKNW